MNSEDLLDKDQDVLNKTTASNSSPDFDSSNQSLQHFLPLSALNEYQCAASLNSRNHQLTSSAEIRTERTAGSLLKNKIRRYEK
jgi:hypothetical protein